MSKVKVGVFNNVAYGSFWLYQNKNDNLGMPLFVATPPGCKATALVLEEGQERTKVLLWTGRVGWVSTARQSWSWSEL
jgi:hypothetical protein